MDQFDIQNSQECNEAIQKEMLSDEKKRVSRVESLFQMMEQFIPGSYILTEILHIFTFDISSFLIHKQPAEYLNKKLDDFILFNSLTNELFISSILGTKEISHAITSQLQNLYESEIAVVLLDETEWNKISSITQQQITTFQKKITAEPAEEPKRSPSLTIRRHNIDKEEEKALDDLKKELLFLSSPALYEFLMKLQKQAAELDEEYFYIRQREKKSKALQELLEWLDDTCRKIRLEIKKMRLLCELIKAKENE